MNYSKLALAKPEVNRLMQVQFNLHTPEHVGQALNNDIRSHWIECLFKCFEKNYNSGSFSYLYPRIKIPEGKKVLPTRLSFEVKLTDILDVFQV